MPWTYTDFPVSLKNFTPEVRNKAIDIANSLLEKEGYEEDRAIPIAIDTAAEWAKNRNIPIREEESTAKE